MLTCIILSVICVLMIVIGGLLDDDSELMNFLMSGGVVGLIGVGIIGFGFVLSFSSDTMFVSKIQPDAILKSNIKVYVEFSEETQEFTSKKDYDRIDKNTIFYKIRYFNFYGIENSPKITMDYVYKKYELNKVIDAD